MTNLRAWVALLVLPFAACQRPAAQPAFDYAANLGIAVEKAEGACLDIPNANLSAGEHFQFVTASAPQSAGEGQITGKIEQACTAADQNKAGLHHYNFKVLRGSLQRAAPAFALVKFTGTLAAADAGVTADIDGDRQPEFFRSCTSAEGVHLTVWKGKPLEGRRRWHYYYYLGYDVDPDCTAADTNLN